MADDDFFFSSILDSSIDSRNDSRPRASYTFHFPFFYYVSRGWMNETVAVFILLVERAREYLFDEI